MNHTTNPQDALTAAVYDALVEFQKTAEWPQLALAQMRQHLAEHIATALPSAVVSADRATLLREAIDVAREEGHRLEAAQGIEAARGARSVAYLLRKLLVKARPADGPSRVAAEDQPAETQWPGERCGLCPPGTRTRHLEDHMVQVHGARPTARPAVGEQPDTQTREARLVELRVRYRVQLRDNDTADWKSSHPSLDYEDREDAEESAAMGRDYFPGREYRVVTRTTTITEQP